MSTEKKQVLWKEPGAVTPENGLFFSPAEANLAGGVQLAVRNNAHRSAEIFNALGSMGFCGKYPGKGVGVKPVGFRSFDVYTTLAVPS